MIWRNLYQNPLRSLLTVLGISLGVAVLLAIQLLNQSAISEFQKNVSFLSGSSNLEITTSSGLTFDERVLGSLNWLWQKHSQYSPAISQVAAIVDPKISGNTPEIVELLGVDFLQDTPTEALSFSSAGKPIDPLSIFQAGQVYVSQNFADRHHLKVGSKITIQLTQQRKSLMIAGIYQVPHQQVSSHSHVIVGDISVIQDFLGLDGQISRIQIQVPPSQVTTLKREIIRRLPTPGDLSVQSLSERQQQLKKMLAAFHTNLQALSLVSLLVGMFLIYNTMSISTLRRRSEIGTLRTLGLTRLQIFGLFLTEASLLGVIGALLGIALGIGIAQLGLQGVSQTLQMVYGEAPLSQIDLAPGVITLAAILGFGMTLIAALPPIYEATRIPPALVSRPHEENSRAHKRVLPVGISGIILLGLAAWSSTWPASNRIPVGGYSASLLLMLGFSALGPGIILWTSKRARIIASRLNAWQVQQAFANLERALTKSSISIASLMVSVALVVSIATMVGSFRHTVVDWVNQSLKADIFIEPSLRTLSRAAEGLSPEVAHKIRQIKGVAAVDDFIDIPFTFRGEPTRLGAGNPEILARYGKLRFVGGASHKSVLRSMCQAPNRVLISESFATHFHLDSGDSITLKTPKGSLRVTISGIYYDYASELGYIILNRKTFAQYFSNTATTNLAVYLSPQSNPTQIRNRIYQQIGLNTPLTIRTNRELRREVLRIFDNTFAITDVLLWVSIVIAALSVAITLFTMVIEFQADFTLLRFLGAHVTDIRRIILWKAAAFGFIGATMGISNGYLLSLLLVHVINKQAFGWTLDFQWSWGFTGQLLICVIMGSIAAGIFPSCPKDKFINPEDLRRA